jgi:uncharacterized protein (DUF2225 family)
MPSPKQAFIFRASVPLLEEKIKDIYDLSEKHYRQDCSEILALTCYAVFKYRVSSSSSTLLVIAWIFRRQALQKSQVPYNPVGY